jgi:hypothetical protein
VTTDYREVETERSLTAEKEEELDTTALKKIYVGLRRLHKVVINPQVTNVIYIWSTYS